jgi:AcrR family transcriptional regulator
MANYKKGVEMRASILDQTREIMNREGLLLTLDQLARKMDITKGRITNYFPTKDQLFVSLSEEYDVEFQRIIRDFDWNNDYSLFQIAKLFTQVMDNQYKYRSVIYYTVVAPVSELEFSTQLQKSYTENGKQVLGMINLMIAQGILTAEILEPLNYDVFLFQNLSVFTNWVMTIRTFQREYNYEQEKRLFLLSILMCYYPYFTALGKSQFEEIKKGN